jgi:signal transduction histidine kinase
LIRESAPSCKKPKTQRTIRLFLGIPLDGEPAVLSIARDISAHRRLMLIEQHKNRIGDAIKKIYEHNWDDEKEIVAFALTQAEDMTGSQIGFFHKVNADQSTIELLGWSPRNHQHCKAVYEQKYPMAKGGIWGEPIRILKPLVVNDYATLQHLAKKGLPEGHSRLDRFCITPVIDGGKAVMVAGIGNKPDPYTDQDLDTLEQIANAAWSIIRKLRHLRELQNARNNAEAASRAQSLFLATMSHELRTPLNPIMGFAEILGSEPNLTEEQRSFALLIKERGQHMLRLVNDNLDLSKIESGTVILENNLHALPPLLRDVCEKARSVAREKGVSVRLVIPPTPLPRVNTDATRLKQILLNLLGNAVKFTPRDGMVQLELETEPTFHANRTAFVFRVKDTGCGIAPENIEKIFHPFVQEDMSYTRVEGGCGLGLAICRRLVELMERTIAVTALAQEGDRERFLHSDMDDYIPKPVDMHLFQKTIERNLNPT